MKTWKAIIRLASNNSQNVYSLFTSHIFQLKIKFKDGGSYFYKNQKYRRLQIVSYFSLDIPNINININAFTIESEFAIKFLGAWIDKNVT